jgi:DNA-binding MarR family transcriptional regulator
MAEESINSSISKISHIHSEAADFLVQKLAEKGLPELASSHGNILFQLSQNQTMTMGELTKKINRDKSTTTVLVRKLKNAGLIQVLSDKNDKRNKILALTEKGTEYTQLTAEISKELVGTFYKGFSDEEKQQFFEFLKRIEKNF